MDDAMRRLRETIVRFNALQYGDCMSSTTTTWTDLVVQRRRRKHMDTVETIEATITNLGIDIQRWQEKGVPPWCSFAHEHNGYVYSIRYQDRAGLT